MHSGWRDGVKINYSSHVISYEGTCLKMLEDIGRNLGAFGYY